VGVPLVVLVLSVDHALVEHGPVCSEVVAHRGLLRLLPRRAATAVPRAVVRALDATAGVALVSVKALAFAGLAVAESLRGALTVVVRRLVVERSVSPRLCEWARAIRAVGTLPVGVARAEIVRAAHAMARALVGAEGCRTRRGTRRW
jgi:hypothetical protein